MKKGQVSALERAIQISVKAHEGQMDKAGAPYVLHPLRLMLKMNSEIEMIAAVLHDVVEDTEWSMGDLRNEGFSNEVLGILECLTHGNDEDYETYISRIKPNPIATKVKLADLEDNMDLTRIDKPKEADFKRVEKYRKAWLALGNSTAE